PLTAVKIAEFTQTYHERFLPAAGPAGFFLSHATDAQRAAIENAAFDACLSLDPTISVRADMDLPVKVFHEYLGRRLGRAVEGRNPVQQRMAADGMGVEEGQWVTWQLRPHDTFSEGVLVRIDPGSVAVVENVGRTVRVELERLRPA